MMRWPSTPEFRADPLRWLTRLGRHDGVMSLTAASSDQAEDDAAPLHAAFGTEAVRAVLSDLDSFGMPSPLAERHELPPVLANLNSALFSMTGTRHREHRRVLAAALSPAPPAEQQAAIRRGVEAFVDTLALDVDFRLLQQTRRLARLVAQEVLLGLDASHEPLGVEIQDLFELRRLANTQVSLDPSLRRALIDQGIVVDGLLRELISERRRTPATHPSVLSDLLVESKNFPQGMSDDELVAHANILFMSSSEPTATALAWVLLAITRLPEVASEIRRQLVAGPDHSPHLVGFIQEVLRLVPPSAILMRIVQRDSVLAGRSLAAGQAILVSPFVEHRRSERSFDEPLAFRPLRWQTERPGPYEFLPFGGGARACLGRRIALETLCQTVRAVLLRGDVVLPIDQVVDWRINVTLQPSPDPILRLVPVGAVTSGTYAEWAGPSVELLHTTQDPT